MYQRHKSEKNSDCWGSNRIHPGTVVHWHEYYEVEYIIEGSSKMNINGISYDYGEGYLSFVSPNDFHNFESLDGKMIHLSVCAIREEALSSEIKKLLATHKPPYILKVEKNDVIARLLNDFDATFVGEGDKITAKYTAELIIMHLIRRVQNGENLASPTSFETTDEQHRNIRMILQYIDEHYAERISREELAKKMGYSPGYLSKLFKKVLGEGLFEHIIGVRMKKARELLMKTDDPIGEIIQKVGYNSPSLFYKHFSEHYKIMPNEAKHQYQNTPVTDTKSLQ